MYILASVWFTKLIKQFFFWIDKIVYNFISEIYDLMLTIARTSILTQADISEMADRIYKLLAIFMIFKVTLSLITYVVNPDDFSDKSKGVSKLGTNIVISLAMLILVPYIFSYAYQLQTIVLEDNSLATLIFGGSTEEKQSFFNTAGDDMAYITMSAFLTPNVSVEGLHECTRPLDPDGKFNKECKKALEKKAGGENFSPETLTNYIAGVENNSLGLILREDLVTATITVDEEEEEFIMDYKFIFSTVVGVVVILLLISFCMDVAVRSLKLAFLQLIAPIPILSFIDPKSGKDSMFKKWYEMCFKTFLSLFIRLLALYFAVYIISKVADGKLVDLIDGSYQTGLLLSIFVIIGALMFAKQLPDMLKGLNIPLDGDGKFTLNPFKKFEEGAIGGKQIGKGIRGAGKYAGRLGKGLGTAALVGGASLVTGHGFRGTGRAIGNAWKGKKFSENFSNSYGAAKARHKQLDEMKAAGVKPSDVRKAKMYNAFHGSTKAEKVAQVEAKAKGIQSSYDTIKTQAVACDSNDASYKYIRDANGNKVKVRTKSAKTISKELDEMKKTQIDRSSFRDIEGRTSQQQYDEAVGACDSKIAELSARKREYQSKTSDINLDMTRLRKEQGTLKREDFSSENDYYEAYAAYTQKLATLEQEKQKYDFSDLDNQIAAEEEKKSKLSVDDFEAIETISADEQYAQAITEQKDAIKAKEKELEDRINDIANGQVYYEKDGTERAGIGNDAADKVISEAKETMIKLSEDVNSIGRAIDSEFKEIKATGEDVVMMMKQSKGAAAQTTTGKMSDIKDIEKYTNKNKS